MDCHPRLCLVEQVETSTARVNKNGLTVKASNTNATIKNCNMVIIAVCCELLRRPLSVPSTSNVVSTAYDSAVFSLRVAVGGVTAVTPLFLAVVHSNLI